MNRNVLVLFTMDVEPVSTGAGVSGPKDEAEGARRVVEYADLLEERGYTPTFFIHPELGAAQRDLFLGLKARGACLGLHLHSAKFAPTGHRVEMGALSYEQQLEVLAVGRAMFERHFGLRPDLFRPGCFSANDYTYKALNALGFKGGGVSIPGRVWTERYCAWAGACPHPHRANENCRLLSGDSPFVDLPLSVDRSRLVRHPLGFDHYFDLRPGDVYGDENVVPRDHRQVLANIVRQLAEDRPSLMTLVVDVHNDRNLRDPSATPARQFQVVLDALEPEMAKHALRPVGATCEQAIDRFNRTVGAGEADAAQESADRALT